jgi:polysaccharide export outer membrane protein
VELDGSVSVPLIGTITMAGLTASEARMRIKSALATKVVEQRMSNGREVYFSVGLDEVTVSIAEYRPVYVGGAVSRPGEQIYRPQMTVRQALASAGGISALDGSSRSRSQRDVLELHSNYLAAWFDFAGAQLKAARLKAELEKSKDFDVISLEGSPIPKESIADLAALERNQMMARNSDFEQEKAFLAKSMIKADEHIALLTNQLLAETDGLETDEQEVKRVMDLFDKRSVTMTRVIEARRSLLLSSTRKLQTSSQLMQVKRQRAELERQSEHIESQRKLDLLAEIQKTNIVVNSLRNKMQGISEMLRLASNTTMGDPMAMTPQIVVHRSTTSSGIMVTSDLERELEPGDVVEVSFKSELAKVSRN